ncbi:phage tail terminator family protein [Secundilactobacillus kimchicus]|uniref:phage tail terminator family protein n=1 Tax=Secundilactobacillus kimchicus TaxID=528209 RepID=UPI0006E30FFB|nr:hypothetical protein [Secundilactobacillus kimchicus]
MAVFKNRHFFVSSIGDQVQPELFSRQKRTHSYQVVYFPDPAKPNSDMNEMKFKLMDQFLELKDFATIRDRNFKPVDGALTVTFDVWVWAYPQDDTPKQQTLKPVNPTAKPEPELPERMKRIGGSTHVE